MLMVAVQKIMTTIHFATMLRNATSLLTSRVQLMMTGARATTGTALKQDTMVRPPAPQWGKARDPVRQITQQRAGGKADHNNDHGGLQILRNSAQFS